MQIIMIVTHVIVLTNGYKTRVSDVDLPSSLRPPPLVVFLAFLIPSPLALTSFGCVRTTLPVPLVLPQFSSPTALPNPLEIWHRRGQPPRTSDQTSLFKIPPMAKMV